MCKLHRCTIKLLSKRWLTSLERPSHAPPIATTIHLPLYSDQRPHLLNFERLWSCLSHINDIWLILQYPIFGWKFDTSILIFITWTKSAGNNIHRTASATRKNYLACYRNKDWCGLLQIPLQTIPLFRKVFFTENCISSGSTSYQSR